MENINVLTDSKFSVKPKKHSLKKLMFFAILILAIAIFIAYSIWKSSGSNQWEFEMEKDGIKVYSLKSPGSSLKQFKAVQKTNYTLTHLVAGMLDDSVATCADWIPGCMSVDKLKPWDSQTLSNTLLWKVKAFSFSSPVELIVHSQVYQDKKTKEVFITFTTLPDFIPKSECCSRLRHMRNTWHYRPLENGQVEVEFIQDFSMGEMLGGLFPDALFSLFGPALLHSFFYTDLPRVLNKDVYRQAKLDFIEEPVVSQ